jgi:hypothetical protein
VQVAPHPVEESNSPCRVGVDQPADVLQVDCEPDQALLSTIVQLALDPAPIGVGSEHEPLPRRSQLLDLGAQLVAQHRQGLDPRILQLYRLLLDYAELSVIAWPASSPEDTQVRDAAKFTAYPPCTPALLRDKHGLS